MKILLVVSIAFLLGCSGPSAREEYYAAVNKTATAQATAVTARYTALQAMATRSCAGSCVGSESATGVAAVMAIAMYQPRFAQPAYIESPWLKWAQVLAGPLVSIYALKSQADLSRDLSDDNRDISIARIETDAATDQALFGLLSVPPQTINFPDIVLPDPIDPGLSDAGLDLVIDGLVDLGTAGLDGLEDVATTGYQTIEDIVTNQNLTLENVVDGLQPIITPVLNVPVINQPVVITPVVFAPEPVPL